MSKPEKEQGENFEALLKLNPSDVESIHVLPEEEEEKPDEPETKYKFGSTQVNLPEGSPAHEAILAMQKDIPDDDLAGKGKDVDDPHVTVRYGLKTNLTPELREFIESQPAFEAKLGPTTSFPPSEHSDGAAPIVAPIVSEDLHRLNKEIEEHGDFAPSSFPDYKPHVTVAYVKPEAAEKYKDMKDAEGKTFPVDSIMVSDRNGDKIEIALKKESPKAVESDTSESEDTAPAPEQTEEEIAPPRASTSVVMIQGGTQLAAAPIQEPVVPIETKPQARVLPLSEIKQMAAGLNPERTVKSVRELMAEAAKRNPTAIVP